MKKIFYWVEIPAVDFDRAVNFYSKLLGVKLEGIDCETEKMAGLPCLLTQKATDSDCTENKFHFCQSCHVERQGWYLVFLKVFRFQYTLYTHQHFPIESLTELAYRCGYYDQSQSVAHD